MRPLLVVLVSLHALCLDGPAADGVQRFSGAFTAGATQQDMEDFQERMRAHGAQDVLLMESHPVQFQVRGLPPDACAQARAEAASLPYVDHAGACTDAPSDT